VTSVVLGAADPSGAAGALIWAHQHLGYVLLVVLACGLVLGLLAVRDPQWLPTLRSYLWLAFAAVVLQGIGGASLLLAGQRPGDALHVMYGPLTLVSLPLALLYSRNRAPRREAWILAAGFLLALLLAVRAVMTG
jgi:hypothetical protein